MILLDHCFLALTSQFAVLRPALRRIPIAPLVTLAVMLLAPAIAHAVGEASTNMRGSLRTTNTDLLDFLQNDLATLCMIVGGIFAAATHVFNNGQGTKFFLSIFGCGVIAMAFTTVLAIARGLATSMGQH